MTHENPGVGAQSVMFRQWRSIGSVQISAYFSFQLPIGAPDESKVKLRTLFGFIDLS
jgi:hypothetical protein